MNKKELRLYLAIAKAEEAAIYRRLRQYRGPIGEARSLLRMSAYKGHVRTLLEMELDKYSDRGTALPKFEPGKDIGIGTVNLCLSAVEECYAEHGRNRLRGDVIV